MDEPQRLESIKKLYDRLFISDATLSKLRNATIFGRLFHGPTDGTSVAGRSIAWKLFLSMEEPLQSSLPPRSTALLESLCESRIRYAYLLKENLRAPDGSPDGSPDKLPSSQRPQEIVRERVKDLNLNNPLSLHDENPWNKWFAGVELRKVICQDVERTFPDINFFREVEVQEQLSNILFLCSVMNPSIGYRQGMHELLAPLYYAVRFDAINEGSVQEEQYKNLAKLCSSEFIAADSWALFDTVMNGVYKWYEWRELSDTPSSPFQNHVILPESGMQPYVAPIVQICNHIQCNLLRTCDPLLYQSMQRAGIEPQIYGIRWLRLLFTREFSLPDALQLWDALFACDASLALAQWVCVAMLIRIRNELIPADYSGQLTTLLRYPSPPTLLHENMGIVNHTSLLVRQGLALQLAPGPETGATIMLENRTLLDIPIEVSSALAPTSPRRRNTPTRSQPSVLPNQYSASPGRHVKQQSLSSATISDFTRGLVERGESLGINKTLMNAVSEIRRNIPEIAASIGVKAPNQTNSAFPLAEERFIEERSPWELRTRFELEKELAIFRSRDKSLGETLVWIVDDLLQDESGARDKEQIRLRKREALESLSYVRDVLMTKSMELDEDRLMGGASNQRPKSEAQTLNEKLVATTLRPLSPASIADSRFKQSGNMQQAFPVPLKPSAFRTTMESKSDFSQTPSMSHTRSTFNTSSVPSATMPRPPTPISISQGRQRVAEQAQPRAEDYVDPLGVLG